MPKKVICNKIVTGLVYYGNIRNELKYIGFADKEKISIT